MSTKRIVAAWAAVIVAATCASALLESCTPQARRDVASAALTAAQIACALGHSELQDADIAKVCAITGDLAPVLRTLIGEHRAAASRERVRSPWCGSSGDAGL